jgi:hypothetical protein
MASTLPKFESSGFLPAGALKPLAYAVPIDNDEALHRRFVYIVILSATTPASVNECGGP